MARFHFLWPSNIPLYICTASFFIHLSIDGNLGWFHIFAIVNNVAVEMEVHTSFQITVLCFFGYTPRSGIIGL